MMKPCSRLWRLCLVASFLLGYAMNPALSMMGLDLPRWLPLLGVLFSAVFLLMMLFAIPKKRMREDGQEATDGRTL